VKAAIIVNPYSGGGRTAQVWGEIRDEVRSRLGSIVEYTTGGPNDATRFATQIASQGDYDLIIAGGGDGTVNEVVNGLFNDKNEAVNPNLKLGILSAGRGCDFIRSVDIPNDYRKAVDILINPTFKEIDVGCAFFKDEFGREQKRFFINIACAGLAGVVAKKCAKAPRSLPPELTYFGAVATSFLTTKSKKIRVIVDKNEVFDGYAMNVFVANGGYSGAGMCWAPMAKVDDDQFEIVIVEPMPKYKIILSAHKLYDGSFVGMPGVHHFSGKTVLVESLDDVYLEIDGEQPGVAPLACSILPRALTIAVSS
jgi:YegS/Rv2252/BmrU family lipid kinase